MSDPKRAPDGRFVPRSGDVAVLPPKAPSARDEHGRFLPAAKVQSSKPYSRAVRELMDAPEGTVPENWPKPPTEAQALAMVHMSMARSGNAQMGLMVVDRAEGKVPQAAEDREAAVAAGSGIRLLADLLGINMLPVLETEEVQDGGLGIQDSVEAGSSPADSGCLPAVEPVDDKEGIRTPFD